MLSKRGEKQGPIVLDPEITAVSNKGIHIHFACLNLIRWLEVFSVEPISIASTPRRLADGSFALHTQKEVDGCLFVSILKYAFSVELSGRQLLVIPRRELV